MKNSILGIMTSNNLSEVLSNNLVKSAMSLYLNEEMTSDELGVEIAKQGVFTNPDFSKMSVVVNEKKQGVLKRKVFNIVKEYGEVDIDKLRVIRDHLLKVQSKYYKKSMRFLKPININKSSTLLYQLIGLYNRLEEWYPRLEVSPIINSYEEFVQKMLWYSMPNLRSKQFNPNAFTEEVLTYASAVMADEERCYLDPYKSLTQYMIKRFLSETKRANYEMFLEVDWYLRFMDSILKVRELSPKFDLLSLDAQKKYVDQWVKAQVMFYEEENSHRNLKKEIGYLRGELSLDRFRRYKGKDKLNTEADGKSKVF